MLDVHPPHERIGDVRDFFLHLLTITIGLLIALGLEASVEAAHHRHQRIEAEAIIRRELQDNRDKLKIMQAHTSSEIANLKKALVFAEDLRSGKKDDPTGIQLSFSVGPLQRASWSTALATGAVSYMEYEVVERYATAYQNQELFEQSVSAALTHFEVLDTYVSAGQNPREMKPQDIETAIPDLRRALADLGSMYDAGEGTLKFYDAALKP